MSVVASDQLLLRQFSRNRDEEAFSEIVRRYAGLVYATCHRVLRDRARAEDVSQETFLRLMRKPEAVDRSLPGWLHRTATHLAIDAIRSESCRRQREAAYAAEPPQETSSWQEISPHIDAALAELPEETRLLLLEHFLQGKPQRELASEVGTSAATVNRRIQQGLEELRACLRSKGVWVGAVILAECLALDSAEAAPPALSMELGKMAMVSGLRSGRMAIDGPGVVPGPAEPVSPGAWFRMALVTLLGVAMIIAFLTCMWLRLRDLASGVERRIQDSPITQRVQP